MSTQRERQEKITRMKLQTVKVLWQEKRKDAAYLVLASIDDPRGDDLREQLGFAEDYDVGLSTIAGRFSWVQVLGVSLVVAFLCFALGFIMSPSAEADTIPLTSTEQVLQTMLTATEPSAHQSVDMTPIVASPFPTVAAMETQQSNLAVQIELSTTARYAQSTATASVRETAAAR